MKPLQRLELLKDLVQQAVDRGATSVEAIHQQIAALPFEMLEKSGLLDDDKLRLRDKQQRTIGTVYDAIRRINRQVGELISDQFELVEDSAHIKKVLDEKDAAKAAARPRKTATKAERAPAKKPLKAKKTKTSRS
ncbi:hypothetical protein [Solimonas terrae]|uniref:Uncharacterized protein n=1 Tax=Solimonas terrae TaxID=1396819 RepID=A0A6M2BL57_9GAMM|nr:hypothetical protein [Solimonas terrae]NGY03492.1 hypothetical protein [Solimonas terrae]